MNILLVWRPKDHELLQGVTLEVHEDGNRVATTTVIPGRATADVSDTVQSIKITLTFRPTVGGRRGEVLRIEQMFERIPSPIIGMTVFEPTFYVVLTGTARRRRIIPGRHPFLLGTPQALSVRTSILDITELVPGFTQQMANMAPRKTVGSLGSQPRLFARIDGVLPMLWIVATPEICRGAAATDLVCFFGPSQNHGTPPTLHQQLISPAALIHYAAVLLGSGTADGGGNFDPELMDVFTPGNIVIAKGFENALVQSGKHAAIAIPVPANRSHNEAATAKLPALLADVHALIVAVGDAHPPLADGDLEKAADPVAKPRLALAAHSRGGRAIWGEPDPGQESLGGRATTVNHPGALAAGPNTYSDLLLFEGLEVTARLDRIARSGSTGVVFIGYDPGTVSGPYGEALKILTLKDRVKRLPMRKPKQKAPEAEDIDELKARSPSLAHALTGIAAPPKDPFPLKHQLCTWSGDDAGDPAKGEKHFLTQALELSSLR